MNRQMQAEEEYFAAVERHRRQEIASPASDKLDDFLIPEMSFTANPIKRKRRNG